VRDLQQRREAQIALGPFDLAHVLGREPRRVGERLLTQIAGAALASDEAAEDDEMTRGERGIHSTPEAWLFIEGFPHTRDGVFPSMK
jgi:hypothetical protein